MGWRYQRGRNWVGALVLIAVGVIGLVSNFNLIPPEILSQTWKLWPAIPLAIGVWVLVRPRPRDDVPPDGGARRP